MPVGMPSPPRSGRWKPRSRAMLGTVGGEEADNAIRAIRSCRKINVRRAFKIYMFCTLPAPRSPARGVGHAFSRMDATKIPSRLGACIFKSVWWRGWYGLIGGGTRVFELAAESREAALGYGARSTSTSLLTSSRPKGGNTTPRARIIVATGRAARSCDGMFLGISRRRLTWYGGFEI
jgi:hypothetical protein